jgi:hypothetical protein
MKRPLVSINRDINIDIDTYLQMCCLVVAVVLDDRK